MCIKMGNDELDSVKALMTMSLNALLAEVFDKELDELEPGLSLSNDLGMNLEKQKQLTEMVAEYFDGLSIDFSKNDTVESVFKVVVDSEFEAILQ